MGNDTDVSWDRDVDLLVAGAGPGGMTVALVSALEGLDVLVCENPNRWEEQAPHQQVRLDTWKFAKQVGRL